MSSEQLDFFSDTSITGGVIEASRDKNFSSTSITGGVIETKHGCVGEYRKGQRWYYRYSYRVGGGKVKHKHIGPITCSLAAYKAERVRIHIANGESVSEILKVIS